jgi:excisionase family DNA binding protein
VWSEMAEVPGIDVIQLSSAEAATLQFHETLNSIIKQVEGLLKVERGSLFLKDPVTNELVFQLAFGSKADQVEPFRVPLGQGLAGQVALTRQPLLKTHVDQNTRNALGVPLLLRGQVMGVLEVIREGSFTHSEVELLNSMAAYAAIAIENAYLHQNVLAERGRVIEVEEQARKKLAHGLHDGPVQLISAALMHLDCCLLLLEKDSTRVAKELIATKQMVEQVAHQIRTLLFELRPLALEAQGLQAALQIFLERQQKNTLGNTRLALEVETINSDGAISRLDSKVEVALFAIAQEAVNNALKYAHADNIVVHLKETANALHVIIVDGGQGFEVGKVMDSYEQRASLGLLTIRERAGLIGGKLTIDTGPDQGTRLTVWAPKTEAARRQKHSTTERLSLPIKTISGKGILENTGDHAKMDEILTVQEVANYLKVSRSTVWRWCNEGRMSAFKVGHGWRVHRSEVERIVGKEIEKISEIESKNNGR